MGQYTSMMSKLGNGIWNNMMGGYRGMIGGNGQGSGMMAYGNGHCGADSGYAGSGYGANATPIHKWYEAFVKILEVE